MCLTIDLSLIVDLLKLVLIQVERNSMFVIVVINNVSNVCYN